MKYKVGDKVRFIKDAGRGMVLAGEIGEIHCCNDMPYIELAHFIIKCSGERYISVNEVTSGESIAKYSQDLNEYVTQDIDFTGCNPVIAEAIKQNKSILCKTNCGDEQNIIHYKDSNCPYVDEFGDQYDSAEPIKKKKTELRVKDRSVLCNT